MRSFFRRILDSKNRGGGGSQWRPESRLEVRKCFQKVWNNSDFFRSELLDPFPKLKSLFWLSSRSELYFGYFLFSVETFLTVGLPSFSFNLNKMIFSQLKLGDEFDLVTGENSPLNPCCRCSLHSPRYPTGSSGSSVLSSLSWLQTPWVEGHSRQV